MVERRARGGPGSNQYVTRARGDDLPSNARVAAFSNRAVEARVARIQARADEWAQRVRSVDAHTDRGERSRAAARADGRWDAASEEARRRATRSKRLAESNQTLIHREAKAWFEKHGLDPADWGLDL